MSVAHSHLDTPRNPVANAPLNVSSSKSCTPPDGVNLSDWLHLTPSTGSTSKSIHADDSPPQTISTSNSYDSNLNPFLDHNYAFGLLPQNGSQETVHSALSSSAPNSDDTLLDENRDEWSPVKATGIDDEFGLDNDLGPYADDLLSMFQVQSPAAQYSPYHLVSRKDPSETPLSHPFLSITQSQSPIAPPSPLFYMPMPSSGKQNINTDDLQDYPRIHSLFAPSVQSPSSIIAEAALAQIVTEPEETSYDEPTQPSASVQETEPELLDPSVLTHAASHTTQMSAGNFSARTPPGSLSPPVGTPTSAVRSTAHWTQDLNRHSSQRSAFSSDLSSVPPSPVTSTIRSQINNRSATSLSFAFQTTNASGIAEQTSYLMAPRFLRSSAGKRPLHVYDDLLPRKRRKGDAVTASRSQHIINTTYPFLQSTDRGMSYQLPPALSSATINASPRSRAISRLNSKRAPAVERITKATTSRSTRPRITEKLGDSESADSSRAVFQENGAFQQRQFPREFPIQPEYPSFYRKFPVSSYFATDDQVGRRALEQSGLVANHPLGWTFNTPTDAFDLYTPRFVKGIGANKLAICPICIEPARRGGEDKRVELKTKVSAYIQSRQEPKEVCHNVCSYHMQYYHGISAASYRPFYPPLAFRDVKRKYVGKNEKESIHEGKCHKCQKWVPLVGVRLIEVQVKELFWWKHAAKCHGAAGEPHDTRPHFEDSLMHHYVDSLKHHHPATKKSFAR